MNRRRKAKPSKKRTLLCIWQIQTLHLIGCSLNLVGTHSCHFHENARNRRQWHAAAQKLRWYNRTFSESRRITCVEVVRYLWLSCSNLLPASEWWPSTRIQILNVEIQTRTFWQRYTRHDVCITSLSFDFFHSWSIEFQWRSSYQVKFKDPSTSYSSSTRGAMTKNVEESRLSRANPRISVKAQRHTHSIFSGRSGSKISSTCEKHIDICNDGAGDWLVHNFDLNKDSGFVNYQTQHRANFTHPPAKLTWFRLCSTFGWSRWVCPFICSTQVHLTQLNRGLNCQANLGRVVGGNIHKISRITLIITIRGGRVPESFDRRPLSVVAALVPFAQAMSKNAISRQTTFRSSLGRHQSQTR